MDTNDSSSGTEKALEEALKRILKDSNESDEITGKIAEEFGHNAGKASASERKVRAELLDPPVTFNAGLKADAAASAQVTAPEDVAKTLRAILQLSKDEHDKVSWKIKEIVKQRPHTMVDLQKLFEPSETASLSELLVLVERSQAWEVALRRELARLLALAKEEEDQLHSTSNRQPPQSHKQRGVINWLINCFAHSGQGDSTNDPLLRPVVPVTPVMTPSLAQQPAPNHSYVQTPKQSVTVRI
eukprot:TRINITY_DN29_c0_g1_i2.p1 TRINITY_DN29_c0_g1~~TRINITY_DN29_c0_g1_i2.p1  ORF type:complete len:243 (-),score=18.92 TRINITY_DN29_c0_g1_i2:750-1478(-)